MTGAPHTQVARQQADIATLTAQAQVDAAGAHARLAPMVWGLLRGMGAPAGGRALAFGVNPQALLTGDPNRREPRDADGFPVHDRWQGPLPGPGQDAYREALPVGRYPLNLQLARPFDVAIASMPYNDIHLRTREARIMRLHSFHHQATEALSGLAPGGHAVFLVNHTVLDYPDPTRWALLARTADFLGAARLPSYSLRAATAGTTTVGDAPVDVLVLRRRQAPHPDPDRLFPRVQWSPTEGVHESTYFAARPDHVLGTREVGTDAWGLQQLTVRDPNHAWPGRLDAVLGQIARQHSPSTPPGRPERGGQEPRPGSTHRYQEPSDPGL